MSKRSEPGSGMFDPVFPGDSQKKGKDIVHEESDAFFEQLKNGHYIGILEDYMARTKWPMDRVARDAWQNFFDTNGYTLDGLDFETLKEDTKNTILIRGNAHYPYTRLLHLGGGHKEDRERSAGGHGEGAKIAALHFLRDYGCSKVAFGCDDWEIEFYLAPPPKGSTEHTKLRGLHVRLTQRDPRRGNYLCIETARPELIPAFQNARNYFRSTQNTDFRELYEGHGQAYENEVGGFIYYHDQESRKKTGARTKGNFYLNGQRISYGTKNTWDTIPGFTFWSSQTPRIGERTLELSRDRDLVSAHELESVFFPFLTERMSQSDLERNITLLQEFYKKTDGFREESEGAYFLKCMVRELAAQNGRCTFDQNMVAADYQGNKGETEMVYKTLEMLGFTVCHGIMDSIGMQKASELYPDLMDLNKLESSVEHRERIRILHDLSEELIAFAKKEAISSLYVPKLQAKNIHLFHNEHPFLQGMYDEKFVWIRKGLLEGSDFHHAFSTYLHELCHIFGTDESAVFSYALTDMLRVQGRFLSQHPQAFQQAEAQWSAHAFFEAEDAADTRNALDYLLGEKQKSLDALRLRNEDMPRDAKKIRWMILDKTGREKMFGSDIGGLFDEILAHPRMKKYQEHQLQKPQELTDEEDASLSARQNDIDGLRSEVYGRKDELKKIADQYTQTRARKIPHGVRERHDVLKQEIERREADILMREKEISSLAERRYAYRKWFGMDGTLLLDLIKHEEIIHGEHILLFDFSDIQAFASASLLALREQYRELKKAGDTHAVPMFRQELEIALAWCKHRMADKEDFIDFIRIECIRAREEMEKKEDDAITLAYAKKLIERMMEK